VYTMNLPGPVHVICMYVCVGTVSHLLELTDLLVVARTQRVLILSDPTFKYIIKVAWENALKIGK
jgi:hypothetical protein